jgi:hypothetical protein
MPPVQRGETNADTPPIAADIPTSRDIIGDVTIYPRALRQRPVLPNDGGEPVTPV